jgi:uncharacterized protein
MSSDDAWFEFAADFSGIVRLFPLPNLVLFPHTVQPLRIFEPRYRAMFEDSIADDQLLAMALLLPGWEQSYFQRPPIAPVVCIGRVLSHSREPNGDYRLMLLGLKRARVGGELDVDRPFRLANVQLLEDVYRTEGLPRRTQLHRRLIAGFQRFLPGSEPLPKHYEDMLDGQVPLGPLTDIVAFYVGLDPQMKQQLLAEVDVDRRAERLLTFLEQDPPRRDFPPDFSSN